MHQASTDEVRAHLPMRPAAFAVVAALANGPRPGIEILDEVNATAQGWTILGPGTLYRLMRELRQQGLIAREERPDAQAARRADVRIDERQAHHALTPLGRAVLKAETARLRRTLELAARAVTR